MRIKWRHLLWKGGKNSIRLQESVNRTAGNDERNSELSPFKYSIRDPTEIRRTHRGQSFRKYGNFGHNILPHFIRYGSGVCRTKIMPWKITERGRMIDLEIRGKRKIWVRFFRSSLFYIGSYKMTI